MTLHQRVTGEAHGNRLIVFDSVSKFYGDVLGVNRVNVSIPPGITSLVGPNGSGKTTLMNLMTGLLRPTSGHVSVVGIAPTDPEALFHIVGYCTQYDTFPRGLTGREFIDSFLRIGGRPAYEAQALTHNALTRVGMTEAADRRIAGYSKGMRQRIKLAQAISNEPSVLVLDEPLNGLDPMARAEIIALFRQLSDSGVHVVISSHILHEVEMMSDRVILLDDGYVMAEGDIRGVRGEMEQEHPMRMIVRCDDPGLVASTMVRQDHVAEIRIHDDRQGLMVSTTDTGRFHRLLTQMIVDGQVRVESVMAADDDVQAVYQYLIGANGDGS
ncbi:MAG: ABC transporter ATP-binding protein [Anaerolineae bacterium]|jgi:ABC-2 type transport system ATP-binding protein